MNTTEKVCKVCNKSKNVSEYWHHPTTKDRLIPYCKECHANGYKTPEWMEWRRQYQAERRQGLRRLETTPVEVCLEEDCSIGSYARGYCYSHYAKLLKGTLDKRYLCECSGEPQWLKTSCTKCWRKRYYEANRPVDRKRFTVLEVQDNGRTCTECNDWKEWEEFYPGSGHKGRMSKCKECMRRRQRERNEAKRNTAS